MPLTVLEISEAALKHNLNELKSIIPADFTLMPVVKSNAYGHGMLVVAKAISSDVTYMVVASLEEGLELRKNGLEHKVLALGNVDSSNKTLLKEAVEANIEFSVYNLETLRTVGEVSTEANCIARIHIKVDTGMGRFGVLEPAASKFIDTAYRTRAIAIQGLFSHLAAADEPSDYTEQQEAKFKQLSAQLNTRDITVPIQHLYNSAGTLRGHLLGNACRIGIVLYGLYPSHYSEQLIKKRYPKFSLKPALTWKTHVLQVKQVPKGSAVSYGCTYYTQSQETHAVLPIGYSDGYVRGLSNNIDVLIHGTRCPIVGRICMNQVVVNVSGLSITSVGDEVVLLGEQDKEHITTEELAKKSDTINYEVISRINPLLPRICV